MSVDAVIERAVGIKSSVGLVSSRGRPEHEPEPTHQSGPGCGPILADVDVTALRLEPGTDLRASLLAYCAEHDIGAACVLACVGSLERAVVRFADAPRGTVLARKLEILTLSGTLSRHGAHLHVSVADADGSVSGGHLLDGSRVYTTAEVVLGLLPGVEFRRELDPATGYGELEVREADARLGS